MANNEFGSYPSSSSSSFGNNAPGFDDAAGNAAEGVRDQAAKYGQKAAEAVNTGRRSAAATLENAAAAVRSKADNLPGGPQVGQYARQAADTLGATAEYLRDHEMSDMMTDLKRMVKDHPTPALIGAAVIGFLVGRSVRSS